jgi:hypothetical protein
MMRTLLTLTWLVLTTHLVAADVEERTTRVLGIGHQYARGTLAQSLDSGDTVEVWLSWLELEAADIRLDLSSKLFADMKPGEWVEKDPLVEMNPLGLIVMLGDEIWSVQPSTTLEGKIMFRQIVRLGGQTFTWADKSGSFMQHDLHGVLKGALTSHSAKNKGEPDGADQPATAPESKPESKEKPKPESKGRSQ